MEKQNPNIGKELADKQHQGVRMSPPGGNKPPLPQGPPPQRPRPETLFEIRSIMISSANKFVIDGKTALPVECFNDKEKNCSSTCAAFVRQKKEKPEDKKQVCHCILLRMPVGVIEE